MTTRSVRPFLPLVAALLLMAAAGHALAASSDWLETEGGSVRIVAAPTEADGTVPAILDIRLKPGWKTYWKDPGASGIPPQVTLSPDGGVALSGIDFPLPKLFDDGVVRYIGYDETVSLPLRLKSLRPGDIHLQASVFLGICKDICIPVQGELALDIPEGSFDNPLDKARIDSARARLPKPAEPDFELETAMIEPDGKVALVTIRLPADAATEVPSIFVAAAEGFAFGSPEEVTRGERSLSFRLPVLRRPADPASLATAGSITIGLGADSMETPLAFE